MKRVEERAYETFVARSFREAQESGYRVGYQSRRSDRHSETNVVRVELAIIGQDAHGGAITKDLDAGRVIARHRVIYPKQPNSAKQSQHIFEIEEAGGVPA
jgi:hypothetical protein